MNSATRKLGSKILVRVFGSRSFIANKDSVITVTDNGVIDPGGDWAKITSASVSTLRQHVPVLTLYPAITRYWVWSPTLGLKFLGDQEGRNLLETIRDVCAQNNWDIPTHLVRSISQPNAKKGPCIDHSVYGFGPEDRKMIGDLRVTAETV